MSPFFQYEDRLVVVVDGCMTREPTHDEIIDIGLFLEECKRRQEVLPVGVGPVPGVGDVWFKMRPRVGVDAG